jgi:hypothetical protein
MSYDDIDRFLDEGPGQVTPVRSLPAAPARPRTQQELDEIDRFLDGPAPAPGGAVVLPSIKRGTGQLISGAGRTLQDLTGENAVTQGLRDYGDELVRENPSRIQSIGDVVESPWTTLKETVGEQLPQLATTYGGAAGGALLGGVVAGPPGAAVGAAIGGLLPTAVGEYGEIRSKQDETGQENIPLALAGAGAATALERFGLEKLAAKAGVKGFGEALTKLPEGASRLAHAGKEAIKTGLTEGPLTEVPQTAIERFAGGEALTGDEALQDYALSGVKGTIGGVAIGGSAALFAPREQKPGLPPPPGAGDGGSEGVAPPPGSTELQGDADVPPGAPPPNPPPSQGGG